MFLDSYMDLYLLFAASIIAYLFALLGMFRARLRRIPNVENIDEAFALLEKSLRETFPDLPEGFTWQEVMLRLKTLGLEMNWIDIEITLKKYEEYRYGGIVYTNTDVKSVLGLAFSLPKGETFAPRS
ncbi:MAG: hypothetical protein ACYC7D_11795 [Nitrososphaerales archaeon]